MKRFITFIFVLALVGLGFLVSRSVPNSKTIVSSSSSPDAQPSNLPITPSPAVSVAPTPNQSPSSTGITGHLFTLTINGTSAEIQSIDVQTKTKKTIYSNQSTTNAIKIVSPVTRQGDTILALITQQNGSTGQLVGIPTDGSGKTTKILDNFSTTEPPAISPDKTHLAIVTFSNADPNYGFNLVYMNSDGTNRKTLTTNQTGISHLAFSPDGKEIAYLKGSAADSSQIQAVTVATNKERTLYEDKAKLIEDFDWSPLGLLAVTAAPSSSKASTQTQVFIVDPKNNQTVQLTKNELPERTPKISPNGSGIAYIQAKTSNVVDLTKPSDIIIVHSDGSKPVNYGTASSLLGWAD